MAYLRAWQARMWAAPLLVVLLLLVHGLTAWWGVQLDRVEGWTLLWVERPPRLRALVGGQTTPLLELGQRWRLASSVLLHGDAVHLLLNASALWVLGRLVEPLIGGLRWLGVFALGGLAGSVAAWLVGSGASDGASGGAFALLGLAVVWGWRFRSRLGPEDARLHGPVLGAFVAFNLLLSLVMPSVDLSAHVGGLLAGVALALVSWPPAAVNGALRLGPERG